MTDTSTSAAETALQLGQQTFADVGKGIGALIPPPYDLILKLVAYLIPIAAIAGIVAWISLSASAHQKAVDAPKIAAATRSADVAGFTAQGAQESQARVDAFQHFDLTVHDAAAHEAALAGAAPDANQPLAPDRADRLHAADAELCRLQPALCPDAQVQGVAGGGS